MTTRRDFLNRSAALAALGASGLPLIARAQNIELAKILCGYPPGGTSDALSRRIAEKLRGNYATNVLVENKPGASGQIAITTLRDSTADGSIMLLTPSSTLALQPLVYKNMPYKLEDVQPVSVACFFNHAFGVGPAVPQSVKTMKEFLEWAKENPGKANYAAGTGTTPHLLVAAFQKLTGSDLKRINYRGSAPAIQDLLAGHVSAMSSPVGDYLPYMKDGKLRILATSGMQRSPFVPEVATYREQGYPLNMHECYAVFLPGRAKAETARRAAAFLQPALAHQDVINSMAQLGMEVQSSTPEALAHLLRSDADEWGRLIKEIGFTVDS